MDDGLPMRQPTVAEHLADWNDENDACLRLRSPNFMKAFGPRFAA